MKAKAGGIYAPMANIGVKGVRTDWFIVERTKNVCFE